MSNDPYLYEQFKESFREHCDRDDPEPTEYDWLKGLGGRLWRDAIDAARSQPDVGLVGSRCTHSHPIDQFCAGCYPYDAAEKSKPE